MNFKVFSRHLKDSHKKFEVVVVVPVVVVVVVGR